MATAESRVDELSEDEAGGELGRDDIREERYDISSGVGGIPKPVILFGGKGKQTAGVLE